MSPAQRQHSCNTHPTAEGHGWLCKHTNPIRFFLGAHPQSKNQPRSQVASYSSSQDSSTWLAGPLAPAETVAELSCKHALATGAGRRLQRFHPKACGWALDPKPASNFALGEVICLQMLCG